ncbi:MAG TPA: hypothetical protein GX005_03490, partial [Bacteroidales bacterium]|nr:hypothetical protein [Bacteroidales bacterium]
MMFQTYDWKESMMTEYRATYAGGYHTQKTGLVHNVRDTVEFATSVLLLEKDIYREDAFLMLDKIVSLQDQDTNSKTFGLWSYYLEEDLSCMESPDYNWADFIGKNLSMILLKYNNKLPNVLRIKIEQAVSNVAACSIKRNVSLDYTNTFFVLFTMLFSGGMVPTYLMNVRYLHLDNTIWIYILPGLVSA